VVKKILVAAVVVLALALVTWWAQRDDAHAELVAESAPSSELAVPLDASSAEREVASAQLVEAARTPGLERAPKATVPTEPFRCRVLDGATDQPIAGARVRFYAPKSSLYSQVRARWPERYAAESYGNVRVHDWPWFRTKPTVEQS